MCGSAEKISIDKDTTTIVNGLGDKEAIQSRIGQIRAQIEKTTSDYDREKLQERLAKLSGGVAVLYVGRSEEHTFELQSRPHLVCRLLLEKKKISIQKRAYM